MRDLKRGVFHWTKSAKYSVQDFARCCCVLVKTTNNYGKSNGPGCTGSADDASVELNIELNGPEPLPTSHYTKSLLMFLEDLNDLGHFIATPQPDGTPFMDMFGNLFQNTSFAIKRQPASLFNQLRHREAFIQQPQLPAWGFRVGGIRKQTTIQKRSVDISYH